MGWPLYRFGLKACVFKFGGEASASVDDAVAGGSIDGACLKREGLLK